MPGSQYVTLSERASAQPAFMVQLAVVSGIDAGQVPPKNAGPIMAVELQRDGH